MKKNHEKMSNFLAYNTPRPPLSVHTKFLFNRSSRVAGYKYTNVLFYYIYNSGLEQAFKLRKINITQEEIFQNNFENIFLFLILVFYPPCRTSASCMWDKSTKSTAYHPTIYPWITIFPLNLDIYLYLIIEGGGFENLLFLFDSSVNKVFFWKQRTQIKQWTHKSLSARVSWSSWTNEREKHSVSFIWNQTFFAYNSTVFRLKDLFISKCICQQKSI